MKFPFKAIFIGMLVGAAIFFVPFRLPFFFLFIFLIICGRFLFAPWRRGYGWRHPGYEYRDEITPIDGYDYSYQQRGNGPARNYQID